MPRTSRRVGLTLFVGAAVLVPLGVVLAATWWPATRSGLGAPATPNGEGAGAPAGGIGSQAGTVGPESQASRAPRFVEEATSAGVEHIYAGGFEFFVGGGVAVFDCDGDELPDLYLAGGSEPAALYRNASSAGGALRFEQIMAAATDLPNVTGAYPLDVDGDGNPDLAVLRRGENVLLRGLGGCAFERANEAWSFEGGDAWTTAFSAAWHGDAAWPTLAFGNYIDEQSDDNDRLCHDNSLFRPGASGAGYGAPIALSPGWCALSMLFSDWDRSGRRDLRVSNDRHYYSDYGEGQEQLWRVVGDGVPRAYTEEDGWQRLRIWGMGIASHDVTGDRYPDYYLTSQGDNRLQVLADGTAQPAYRDIALRHGVTAHRPYAGGQSLPSTAWHAEFDDVNNDGFVDLYVAKGNVEAQQGYATRDPSNLLLGQADGSFVESGEEAGIVDFARSRGGALADLNADGLLDLVEVKRLETVRLWRNTDPGAAERAARLGNWLAVRLRQGGGNRDAIGAWIEVRAGDRTTVRELTVGGGHAGGQFGPVHFGLGDVAVAQVRVTWPDGTAGEWLEVAANHVMTVER